MDSDSPVSDVGGYRYPYSISIGAFDEISTGNFFRVYDFNGLVPGSIQTPAGWSAAVSLSDQTPPPNVLLSNADDPLAPNLTFTYTGTADITGDTTISGFSALGLTPSFEVTDGVARVTNATSIGGNVDSDSTVIVPVVPEPAAATLLVLTGGGALLRRRKAR